MKFPYISFALLIICCSFTYGQQDLADMTPYADESPAAEFSDYTGFDFFASDEPLEISLSFDIREFVKTKDEPEYFDASLKIITHSNDTLSQRIKLKARGEMRRDYCSFPPVLLKFKDNKDEDEPIQQGGTIKLVTHCHLSPTFENYVFKEYLAYKLYNQVTPYSFRTRLARITYTDVNNPNNTYTSYGFLIENTEEMARRNDAIVIKNLNVSQQHMNSSEMARLAVFNYMIGNTDWSVQLQHNIKVLKALDVNSDKGIPVAYDFDFSGFVNTMYSAPREELPIKSVTERYYMGTCFGTEELTPIIEEFGGKKEELLGTISSFEFLSDGEKKEAEMYISSFYRQYKYPNALINGLNRTCKRY